MWRSTINPKFGTLDGNDGISLVYLYLYYNRFISIHKLFILFYFILKYKIEYIPQINLIIIITLVQKNEY